MGHASAPNSLGYDVEPKVLGFQVSKYNYLYYKYNYCIIIKNINIKNSIICVINIIIINIYCRPQAADMWQQDPRLMDSALAPNFLSYNVRTQGFWLLGF